MFGIIRPCRHRLSERLQASWMAHLCGLCLALRDDHGQLARTATNYDGLIISVLVEAQSAKDDTSGRRTAGPCPLRGMRTASVAKGEGARLAAAVSLTLASVKIRDHVEDGDGVFARRPVAAGARAVTRLWDRRSAGSASVVGFDTAVLLDAAARQGELERGLEPGGSVLLVTEPTESATSAAFAHTAALSGRPGNAAPLAEAGRLFGRLAHLLDAAEDQAEDAAAGAWNPLTATGTDRAEAERLCRDAVHGIRLALREVELTDRALVHVLLAHETERAVERVFGPAAHTATCKTRTAPDGDTATAPAGSNPYQSPPRHDPNQAPPAGPGAPVPPWVPQGPGFSPPGTPPPHRRNLLAGCAVWALMACSCQLMCCDHNDPFSREHRPGWCARQNCDCGCGDCFQCCQCCGDDGCCDGCDCGCDGCDCGGCNC
ncbi:DUF5685 family protein [Streptomyces sp. CB01881]|uniref:DUF5685 family protein n=1 Tax=Streptomyces sp. CB01881 TaxID=2078691 RepID=UPI000CDBFD7F|nr:DUF5685 family protein [Streptomyces sp. CB01881]AUY48132.1 hypothetical protein C2142_03215 [Streptomyces sp. CB01881]TYC76618.1 hypothetical protein EH183_03230 [Streptomyces sp. CB01881]